MDRYVLRPGFRREALSDFADRRGWALVNVETRSYSEYHGRVWRPDPAAAGVVVYREDHALRGALLVLDGIDAGLRDELLEICPALRLEEALDAARNDNDPVERVAALSRLAHFSV